MGTKIPLTDCGLSSASPSANNNRCKHQVSKRIHPQLLDSLNFRQPNPPCTCAYPPKCDGSISISCIETLIDASVAAFGRVKSVTPSPAAPGRSMGRIMLRANIVMALQRISYANAANTYDGRGYAH